jgi:hypothetical protein
MADHVFLCSAAITTVYDTLLQVQPDPMLGGGGPAEPDAADEVLPEDALQDVPEDAPDVDAMGLVAEGLPLEQQVRHLVHSDIRFLSRCCVLMFTCICRGMHLGVAKVAVCSCWQLLDCCQLQW